VTLQSIITVTTCDLLGFTSKLIRLIKEKPKLMEISNMKKLFIILAVILSLTAGSAEAAKTAEVLEFEQTSELSISALRREDYDAAFKHLNKAAKLGNKVSQFNLALLYMEGLGVKQDYAQAYLWLNVAVEAKEKSWRKVRDQIHSALSKEQITALTPFVNDYIKKYGARAQGVNCSKKPSIGTKIKAMQCTKRPTPKVL